MNEIHVTSMHQGERYNDEIQVLRAIAILFVIVSHSAGLFVWNSYSVARHSAGFWSGVDLFFCVSGYVITRTLAPILLNSHGNKFWQETAAFWVRRLYRITPSAWLWVILPIGIGFLFNAEDLRADLSAATAILLHVANLHFYYCWTELGACGRFEQYWSLSLEEQFYLLLPIVFLIFRKRVPVVLVVLVISQVFIPRGVGGDLTVFTVVKTDAILIGVLLALFSKTDVYRLVEPNLHASRFKFLIPPMLLFCLVAIPRYKIVPFYTGLIALVCGLIVWLCSYNKGYFIRDGVVRRILVWIGARSFSIYLIQPAMYFLTVHLWMWLEPVGTKFDGSYTLRFALTAFLLILVMAELNYRLIEAPFRKRGKLRAEKLLMRELSDPAVPTPRKSSLTESIDNSTHPT